jgi:hypothetical protein
VRRPNDVSVRTKKGAREREGHNIMWTIVVLQWCIFIACMRSIQLKIRRATLLLCNNYMYTDI